MSYTGPVLTFRERDLDKMLHSRNGEVGRHLNKIGLKILAGAQAMVGVRTGNLRRSLHMRHARDARGQYVQVGSKLGYALLHHEGSRPHVIISKSGRILTFSSGGKRIFAQHTNHPGFRGRKYLTIPLRRAVK